jgi:ribose-phosphate pyrophosphokinase
MKYKKIKYPDGSFYAEVESFDNPTIVERINTYEDLFFIKSLKEICDYNNITNVKLVIPCMFHQQHDRRFAPNQSFELKLICEFINSCNFSEVYVFHPHSDATQMGLNNIRVIDNTSFIKKVFDDINSIQILFSTDAGSFKWINKLADSIFFQGEVYAASKSRDVVTHRLTQIVDKQDFGGKDILIIDDLCVYGGTFIGLAKLLKERNAGKLFLAVSHMTMRMPNKELEQLYEKIYTTNSKYDSYELNNLNIIKLEQINVF